VDEAFCEETGDEKEGGRGEDLGSYEPATQHAAAAGA
jgi:hypothetical protein